MNVLRACVHSEMKKLLYKRSIKFMGIWHIDHIQMARRSSQELLYKHMVADDNLLISGGFCWMKNLIFLFA